MKSYVAKGIHTGVVGTFKTEGGGVGGDEGSTPLNPNMVVRM